LSNKKPRNMTKGIAIIGGGAAGLMAAATIGEFDSNAEVFLLEKNDELGKKVLISGGGRCNFTTGLDDLRQVLARYPRGDKFLTKAMHAFPPKAMRKWLEDHGVPIKIESDLRAFPKSNDGRDVVRVFEKIFASARVKVMFKSAVQDIEKMKTGFDVTVKGRSEPLEVDKVILATGGQAYRQTGSTGDGYSFATALGHSITPLAPSLSAFYTQESWPVKISGLSFQSAKLDVMNVQRDRVKRDDEHLTTSGAVLFTHKGITGPAVFALSSLVAFETIATDSPLLISIDIFSDRKAADLASNLVLLINKYPKKSLSNVLSSLVPKSFAVIVCEQLKMDPDKAAGQTNKKNIEAIAHWLKNIPLHVAARAAGEEFVTAGGVDLSEVNPSTMESKKCSGLYLAGEILDIDGFTGGFNLQSAWATGRMAGMSAANQSCHPERS